MTLTHVPLLPVLREVYRLPPGRHRFQAYLRAALTVAGDEVELVPLLAANPMAKPHAALLDDYLALDAEGVAAAEAAAVAARHPDLPGDHRVGLTLMDDLAGGGTNRFAEEHAHRFGPDPGHRRFWVTAVLWASEPASAAAVRQAVRQAAHRTAHVTRHGPARTLRQKLAQEAAVLAASGAPGPALDPDDLAYTREVLAPLLDADDLATAVTALFGDAAGATLGFRPLGLSPNAGLAVARAGGS